VRIGESLEPRGEYDVTMMPLERQYLTRSSWVQKLSRMINKLYVPRRAGKGVRVEFDLVDGGHYLRVGEKALKILL